MVNYVEKKLLNKSVKNTDITGEYHKLVIRYRAFYTNES